MNSYFRFDMGLLDQEVAAVVVEEMRRFKQEKEAKLQDIEQLMEEISHLSKKHV